MRVVLGEDPPEKVWTNYYERSAQAAESLSHTASELGAGVFRRATLADFGHASERYEQVILMAHWRGAVVSAADVCDRWQEILERVRIGNDPVLRLLRVESFNIDGLVDALNLAITSGSLLSVLPADLGVVGRQSVALGRTLSRDVIDEVFGELIAPGNGVELFDGLHTLAEINDALGKDFTGELDLTLCNSEALAVFLDLSRGNRLQHIHRGDRLIRFRNT